MCVHIGTHVDAPCHFVVDGPAAHEVPMERLHGAGIVWRIDVGPLGEIDVGHLERATPRMQRGDIVLISTGWAKHINTPMYEDHAALTVPAAEWLVAQGAKMIGVDFSTPDLTVHKRPKGFTWPVHQVLLANGVLIAEHVTGLDTLENSSIEAMFFGLNIQDSDGMPARAIARRVRG
jgi:kynurenine formamidase